MVVNGNYQLEIDLRSFANPTGRVAGSAAGMQGVCCEPLAMCIPEDTCDVQIRVMLQNFDFQRSIGTPANYMLGTFDNVNSIMFPTCGTIMSGVDAALNPLTFTFPTAEFSQTVSCHYSANGPAS